MMQLYSALRAHNAPPKYIDSCYRLGCLSACSRTSKHPPKQNPGYTALLSAIGALAYRRVSTSERWKGRTMSNTVVLYCIVLYCIVEACKIMYNLHVCEILHS